jgi:hypothetical protein
MESSDVATTDLEAFERTILTFRGQRLRADLGQRLLRQTERLTHNRDAPMKINSSRTSNRIQLASAILRDPSNPDAPRPPHDSWTGTVIWDALTEDERALRLLEVLILRARKMVQDIDAIPFADPNEKKTIAKAVEHAIELVRNTGNQFALAHDIVIPG